MDNNSKKRKHESSNKYKNKAPKKTIDIEKGFSDKKKILKNKKSVRFKSEDALIKKLTCPKCGKTFSRKSNLNTHLKLHTNIQKFSCSVCKLKFSVKGNMQRHERLVHKKNIELSTTKTKFTAKKAAIEKKRKFSCDICDARLCHRSSLFTHIQQLHGNPYKCTGCNKSLLSRNEFEMHNCVMHLKSNVLITDNIVAVNNSLCDTIEISTDNSDNEHMEESNKNMIKAQHNVSSDDLIIINDDDHEQKILCIVCQKYINSGNFWEHKMRHLGIVDLLIENIDLNKSQHDNIVKLNEGQFYVRNLQEVMSVKNKPGISNDDSYLDTYTAINNTIMRMRGIEEPSNQSLCDKFNKASSADEDFLSNNVTTLNAKVSIQVEEKKISETKELFDIDELLKSDSEDELDCDASKDALKSDEFYGFTLEPNSKPPVNPLLRKFFDSESLEERMKMDDVYANLESKRNTSEIITNVTEIFNSNVTEINTNVTKSIPNVTKSIPNVTKSIPNVTGISTNVRGISTNVTGITTNVTDITSSVTGINKSSTYPSTNKAEVHSNAANNAKNYTVYKSMKEIFLTTEDLMKIGSNEFYNNMNTTQIGTNTSETNSNNDKATESSIQVRTDLNTNGSKKIFINKVKVIDRNTLTMIDTNCGSNKNLVDVRNSLKSLFLEQEKKIAQENATLNKQIYLSNFKTSQTQINFENLARRLTKPSSQKTKGYSKTTNSALRTTKDALEKTKSALNKILESSSKKTNADNSDVTDKKLKKPRRRPVFKCTLCYEVFYHKLGLNKHYILTHLYTGANRRDEVNKQVSQCSTGPTTLTEGYKCPLDKCRFVASLHNLKSGAAVRHLINNHKIFPYKFIKSGHRWIKI